MISQTGSALQRQLQRLFSVQLQILAKNLSLYCVMAAQMSTQKINADVNGTAKNYSPCASHVKNWFSEVEQEE